MPEAPSQKMKDAAGPSAIATAEDEAYRDDDDQESDQGAAQQCQRPGQLRIDEQPLRHVAVEQPEDGQQGEERRDVAPEGTRAGISHDSAEEG